MKEILLLKLHDWIDKQIYTAKQAMDAAQESATSDGKSSAGDKFETGRAMGHRDRDMFANQLSAALKEKESLHKIDLKIVSPSVCFGSLVETTAGIFFISISMGKIKVEDKIIFAVSPQAPVCKDLIGKVKNDSFLFQGIKYEVIFIY
ncbi:MAG: hypothetical protein RLZZ546_444 [Bacteroidota bacterium]|jgi:hypothetical protein